ncbi:MAG TPA: Rossmann-like and DUF2520 domain-containing protein [Planctomycetota bacterium]|nr:Rossmann-like and DUF2520 domain-containing protein [Planctomycetota bacterium]
MGTDVELAIIGAGRCGRTLGRLALRSGWRIGAVTCRTMAHARDAAAFIGAGRPTTRPEGAALTLIAVPDAEIEGVARELRLPPGGVAAHTCASFDAEVLRPLRPAGAVHPLRSFADPKAASARFPGTACAIDGDPAALRVLRRFVRAIGGDPLRVKRGRKALYHAGAVFASNYVVTVLNAALSLLVEAGVKGPGALKALTALAEGTLSNIGALGIPGALTGPIERGDARTLRRHVAALRSRLPRLVPAYGALGSLTIDLAVEKGSVDRRTASGLAAVLGSSERSR